MKNMLKNSLLPLLLAMVLPTSAHALQYTFGEIDVNLATTFSVSASVRTSKQDCRYISVFNGGCYGPGRTDYDVNSDDGDVNVEQWDFISAPVKGISELEVTWRNFGAFVRGKAAYDYVGDNFLGNGDGKYGPVLALYQRRPLEDQFRGDDARNLQATDFKLLDAFAYANFDAFDMPVTVRIGRQATNWGESLLIPGGVSSYLPLDVSAYVKPGVELKEIFLPQAAAFTSIGLPAGFTFEGWYAFQWNKSKLPACGSFFSPSDALADGCSYALSGGEVYNKGDGTSYSPIATIERGASQEARQQGQYGLALRYYADWLNYGTEMAGYFVNFHSKLPIGTFTASQETTTTTALKVLCPPGAGTLDGPGCQAAAPGFTDDAGRPISVSQAMFAEAAGANKTLLAQYPEDIKMIGASFNTTMSILNGTAISGDFAFYPNMPFQLDTTEIQGADAENFGYTAGPGEADYYTGTPVAPGDVIPGYRRTRAIHAQLYTLSTLTPSNPVVKFTDADLLILVANAGFQWLPDAQGNRFAIPRSSETHPAAGMAATFGDACIKDGACSISPQYASQFSWGYRLIAMLQYNSAFGSSWTLTPQLVWSHDVQGYSAGPIGPGFVQGKMAVTAGVTANYQDTYKVGLDYTANFGADYRNASYDKDFVSMSASYAF